MSEAGRTNRAFNELQGCAPNSWAAPALGSSPGDNVCGAVRHFNSVSRDRRPLEKHRGLLNMVGQAGCRLGLCSGDPRDCNHGAGRGQGESASCRCDVPCLPFGVVTSLALNKFAKRRAHPERSTAPSRLRASKIGRATRALSPCRGVQFLEVRPLAGGWQGIQLT